MGGACTGFTTIYAVQTGQAPTRHSKRNSTASGWCGESVIFRQTALGTPFWFGEKGPQCVTAFMAAKRRVNGNRARRVSAYFIQLPPGGIAMTHATLLGIFPPFPVSGQVCCYWHSRRRSSRIDSAVFVRCFVSLQPQAARRGGTLLRLNRARLCLRLERFPCGLFAAQHPHGLAPTREVAQIGAALGRQFSHALISAVASTPQQPVDDALAQLVRQSRGDPTTRLSQEQRRDTL